jgi:hypothetical protein
LPFGKILGTEGGVPLLNITARPYRGYLKNTSSQT